MENLIRRLFFYLILVGSLILPVHDLSAQTPPRPHLDFGIGGGASIPEGDLSNIAANGYHVGCRGNFYSEGLFRLDVGVHYNSMEIEKSEQYFGYPSVVIQHGDLSYWMINAGLDITPLSFPAAPYFGIDFIINILGTTPSFESETSHAGFGIGGGIKISLIDPLYLDCGVQYQVLNFFDKGSAGSDLTQVAAGMSLMLTVF